MRFLVVGGVNTLVTGGIFLALSSVTAPAIAYTIAFVVGIGFALVVTPRFVFRTRGSRPQGVRYLAWYLTIYVFGLGMVYVLHDLFQLSITLVAAVTSVATAGLSFMGARFLFEGSPNRAANPSDGAARW